jgi:uncharacterized protein (TIGR00297 family)
MISFFERLMSAGAENWTNAGILVGFILGAVAVGELLYHVFKMPQKNSRKIVHLLVGIVVGLIPFYISRFELAVAVGVFFIGANLVSLLLGMFSGMHDENDKSYGTVVFPLTYTFLVVIGWPNPWFIAIPMFIMAVSDAAAALVGQNILKPKPISEDLPNKSMQGSLALGVTAALILGAYFYFVMNAPGLLWLLPVFAFVLILSELVSKLGSDNFSLPLFALIIVQIVHSENMDLFLYAFAGVAVIAMLSRWLGFLSDSGIVFMALLGIFTFTFGQWQWSLPLVAFFLSSSLLAKLFPKNPSAEAFFEKSDKRDAGQVLANGGLPFLFLFLDQYFPGGLFYTLGLIVLSGATADTWATEIGSRFGGKPFHLRTGSRVDAGSSGAISLPGTMASLAGAGFIAAMASPWVGLQIIIYVSIFGFLVSLIDSILGAWVQLQLKCPDCGKIVETKHHCNNVPTEYHSGLAYIRNNQVNILSMVLAAIIFSLI